MATLLIPHKEFTHGSKGFPVKHGGFLTFQSGPRNEPVSLSDPIIKSIELACAGIAEFFEVTITGKGTTLDYYLIGDDIDPFDAAVQRLQVTEAVTHILMAFQKDLKITQIKFQKIG